MILHSPTRPSLRAKDLTFTPTSVRVLPAGSPEDHSRFFRTITSAMNTNDLDENTETIALFDECILYIITGQRQRWAI